jgi:class 3 adenylate cyclase
VCVGSTLIAESFNINHEDRGDGALILIPPTVTKTLLVDSLPQELVAALDQHNNTHPREEQIRLRMALHAGEVHYDNHGVAGASINLTFRLLHARALKDTLTHSSGTLALITSPWFYDEVVRHSLASNHTNYHPVQIIAKETTTTAWIHLPNHANPTKN